MKSITDVAAAVKNMARVYDKAIDGETIAFLARVLVDRLSADEACIAIATWCATEPRWPAPAQIIALVHPPVEAKDEAAELASALRRLIARRGYTWEQSFHYDGYASIEEAISSAVGEGGLAVVRRCGGWSAFCREWGGEVGDTAARAQLRELCGAVVRGREQAVRIGGIREQAKLDERSDS